MKQFVHDVHVTALNAMNIKVCKTQVAYQQNGVSPGRSAATRIGL